MKSAIVLDGGQKSALAIVRSLGRRGIPVSVGAEHRTGMALHSRYATGRFIYPSPYTEENGFIDALIAEAKRLGDMPVIFACSDATFLAIYNARERISMCTTLLFSDTRAMEIAFDKAVTYSLARVSGIPTIATHMPTTKSELRRVAEKLTYPVVVKPRKSVTTHQGSRHFGSASFVHTADELTHVYETLHKRVGESPLVQERVVGEEYGVETIAREGIPHAVVTHHRLRSLSPTGGASVLKITLEKSALRDMLETYARKIVSELRWSGPLMVEFKVDSDTKVPKLMEINGRFWGSLPLSVAAGVDMPYHYYHLVTTGSFPNEVVEQRDGVVTRHFLGDVRHLLTVFFARTKMRSHAYPKRLTALREFLHPPKGTRGDVWSLHDPKPAMMEAIDIWKRRKKK